MEQQLQQAVQFFKSEPAYKKLFIGFVKKYESLGRIGGTVPTALFTEEERQVLGRFFGVPGGQLYEEGSISLHMFEEQLKNTRFQDIGLQQLLEAYFGKIMISKRQQQMDREENIRLFLLDQRARHPILASWLGFLLEINGEGRWIIRLAEKDPRHFASMATSLAHAMKTLPSKAERLPMFSQRITGNPHAFDLDRDLGKMFLHLLSVDRFEEPINTSIIVPTDTEAVNELLNKYHLYRDDLLNFVTAAGLHAEDSTGIQEVWKAAVKRDAVQILPLRELVPLKRVYPAFGKIVWIVENSGVCSVLLDKEPRAAMICTNGQFTLAALVLLDLLVEEDCQLYYAGDFDPEGLGMAQRLLNRYPEHVELWRMDPDAYQASHPVNVLPPERLEKLKGIVHEDLIDVAKEMWRVGKAGYQEALVDLMVDDLGIKE